MGFARLGIFCRASVLQTPSRAGGRSGVCKTDALQRAAFAAALLFAATVTRAVAPNLASVAPAGGQRGTNVEVALKGERLADAQEVFLYGPGITVEKIVSATATEAKAIFKIAADCPLGEHALRLRT